MRIAVTGKKGQVVQSLIEAGPLHAVDIIPVGRPEAELTDADALRNALADARPDVIVSAAAYTAVDKAESERELAFAVNAAGAETVALAAAALGIPVIHLSTDYVFSGTKPAAYLETDPTAPVSVYGASKLEGERRVAEATPNHVILRTCWVYSPFGANFLKTMLRLAETRDELGVVADQHGCPTSALDIADAVIQIAKRLKSDPAASLRGIFHLSGRGEANWADFAEAIFGELEKRTGKAVRVKRITTADYQTPAARPANSLLDTTRLQYAYGIALPDWRLSVETVVDRLVVEGESR
jgi:dTDP-4-dehydrorhamnose reductase